MSEIAVQGKAVSPRWARIAFPALLIALLGLGIQLRLQSAEVASRTPDEDVYNMFARTAVERGFDSTRQLVALHHENEDVWIYPTPIRIGYIYPVAAAMRWTGLEDHRAGARLSLFFSALSLCLLAWVAVRHFHRWAALGAVALAAVSPMDLAMARRSWQETMVGFFCLLLVYFCCEIGRDPRRRIWYLLFGSVGAYALLIKEGSCHLIYALLCAWILLVLWIDRRSIARLAVAAALCLIPPLIALGILSLAAGGVGEVLSVIRHNTGSIAGNRYAIEFQSGPWYSLPQGLWLLSPLSLVLFLGGTLWTALQLLRPAMGEMPSRVALGQMGAMALFVMAFTVAVSVPDYYKNLRYVSPVFGPMYLVAGAVLWYLASVLRRRFSGWMALLPMVAIAGALCYSCYQDHGRFQRVFVEGDVPDLVNRLMLKVLD